MKFVSQISGATPTQMLSLAAAVNKALRGECCNVGAVSVAAGATSATITDPRCAAGRTAMLLPLDANAAAANWYLSAMGKGSMTFTFTSAPGAAAFNYIIFGE